MLPQFLKYIEEETNNGREWRVGQVPPTYAGRTHKLWQELELLEVKKRRKDAEETDPPSPQSLTKCDSVPSNRQIGSPHTQWQWNLKKEV